MDNTVKRDSSLPGQKTEFPYFYGPFTAFQPIEIHGFASEAWLRHSANVFEDLKNRRTRRSSKDWVRKGLKCLLNMEWRSIFPRKVERLLYTGDMAILDIGGGWGDNYLHLKKDGVLPRSNISYTVLDNAEQSALGRRLLGRSELNFTDTFEENKYNIVVLIGTLQYIEKWDSILFDIHRKGVESVYIHRTPFTRREDSYVVVQSVVPASIDVKAGEENLNVISWQKFTEAAKEAGWSIRKLGPKQDYSANLARLPQEYRSVFYQRILLERR